MQLKDVKDITQLVTYVRSNGDGSCSVLLFTSKEKAERYASFDDERNCDDINGFYPTKAIDPVNESDPER